MAKAKKKKAKAVKKAKKASAKKTTKKKAVKKAAKKKLAKKKKVKKIAKKKPVAKKAAKKKKVAKVKTKAKVADKAPVRKERKAIAHETLNLPVVKYVPDTNNPKPEKERKKSKEELAAEEPIIYDDGEAWEGSSFAEMKNYEPAPVYRKPDPPQPKFQGKKDTRTRYSDKELSEFRSIINEKIVEAERDYELLKNTLAHRDEHGTDDTSPTFKVLEDGSDAMSREEIAQLASRQDRHIQNLKNALIRIENKTYGICRATGKLIPKERLRSVPHATLSIEAKLTQNS